MDAKKRSDWMSIRVSEPLKKRVTKLQSQRKRTFAFLCEFALAKLMDEVDAGKWDGKDFI